MARASFAPPESSALKQISVLLGRPRAYDDWLRSFGNARIALCPRTRHNALRFVAPHGLLAMPTLAMVSPYLLGFDGDQPLHRIMAAAKERGLLPCPSDVGPTVRLAYENQPDGEVVTVVHRSFCDDIGMVNFALGNSGGERWLRAVPGEAATTVPSDTVLMFIERKRLAKRS